MASTSTTQSRTTSGRLFVLNIWTRDSGWVRMEFPSDDERARFAYDDAPLGADVRFSDR